MDAQTEKRVIAILLEEFSSYTIISIAHKLDAIPGFDKVIVMVQGKIVEVGPLKELKALKNGRFRDLWQAQIGGREKIVELDANN